MDENGEDLEDEHGKKRLSSASPSSLRAQPQKHLSCSSWASGEKQCAHGGGQASARPVSSRQQGHPAAPSRVPCPWQVEKCPRGAGRLQLPPAPRAWHAFQPGLGLGTTGARLSPSRSPSSEHVSSRFLLTV